MDWNEPALIERKYQIGADQVTVVARVGFPRPTKRDQEWACSFQLFGWSDGRVRIAHGVDGLQALMIAASTIRQWLDSASRVSSTESPYEVVFPKYVPFSHGLEFHRHLCRILDEEIEKEERGIEAKRISRERGEFGP
ncbi:MAG: hypothetical protein WBE69_19820, partial [Candidatus Binataceae bacterium]